MKDQGISFEESASSTSILWRKKKKGQYGMNPEEIRYNKNLLKEISASKKESRMSEKTFE